MRIAAAIFGTLALAASASAQLVSSWTAPSFDDGNPIPNFVASWRTDLGTGQVRDLPTLPGTRALAADSTLRRLYTAGDSLSTFGVDSNGVLVRLSGPVRITDANGTQAQSGQVASMGFARGVIYASISSSGSTGIPAGLYTINTETARATLVRPSAELPFPTFPGMDFNAADGFMYAVAGSNPQRIVRIDLDALTVTTLADVPVSAYNGVTGVAFDGLAAGNGKVFLTHALNSSYGNVPFAVYDLASGTFGAGLPSPNGSAENRIYNAGATFVDFEFRVFNGPSRPERGVQIRSVNFQTGVIELFNFNPTSIDLTGWRFQSFDVNEFRLTTAATGLNGVVIEGGTSVFIYFNNNAPAGNPDRLNRTALGGSFALPLDQDAYALQLYFPGTDGTVNIGDPSTIADHIQWNIPGQSVGTSQTRTDAAVAAGVWSRLGDFIATQSNSTGIDLTDLSGDDEGSPAEYSVDLQTTCPADFNNAGGLDVQDIFDFLNAWFANDPRADFDDLNSVDISDIFSFLNAWFAGC